MHPAPRSLFAGFFLVTLSTLVFEILLTRIFSVTMWYHFAFMAISVAMFGMTAGAVAVYVGRGRIAEGRVGHAVTASALLFAGSIVPCFLGHLSIPFAVHDSATGAFAIAFNYLILSLPFFFSGACVTLVLTRFPQSIGQLYATDLAGAGLGCLLVPALLAASDGPTAVVIAAALGALGAGLCGAPLPPGRLKASASLLCVLLLGLAAASTVLVHKEWPLLRLMWVKGALEKRPLYEAWNSFSRVTVDHHADPRLHVWGISSTYPEKTVPQLHIEIDASASTDINGYQGDLDAVDFLRAEVTNVVHFLRPRSDVLVIGVGGGRDLLSALAFDQKSVTGVEINGNLLDIVQNVFGEFAGHVDRDPRVTLVNDEGRSYITRMDRKVDILQISLIDTWAATAAGAFALSENALYTVEAWGTFLDRLTDRGVISVSRWFRRGMPVEVYRTLALATAALRSRGVRHPRQHLLLCSSRNPEEKGPGRRATNDVGTILVGRSPFTPADVATLQRELDRLKFSMVLTPALATDAVMERLANGQDLDELYASFPLDISPPTDDSPFFFQVLRWSTAFQTERWKLATQHFNTLSVVVLAVLVPLVILLAALLVLSPWIFRLETLPSPRVVPLGLYFGAIGMGFMFIEISQLQRLGVFLGHPTYALTVVLFTLLLATGLGSHLGQRLGSGAPSGKRLWGLLAALVAVGLITPAVTSSLAGSTTPARVAAAVAMMFLLGIGMGLPFPLGMQRAQSHSPEVTPWYWAVNGAGSVCASVFAVVVALVWGIAASYWIGTGCYLIAALAFLTSRP